MKKVSLYILCFLLTSAPVFGQKYKDIFPTLDAKNYEEGEPLLRAFMANPKNQEHPNANYQMALLLEEKISKLNVINDSTRMIRYSDSIKTYYTNARNLITEKELKKKDEYYQAYYRRDMRTGEFTIKKSDIDADIDKKLDYYASVKEGTKFLAANLERLSASMEKSREIYAELTSGFNTYEGFALSLGDESLDKLAALKAQNLKTRDLVNTIQDKVASLPELGFNSDEKTLPVKDLSVDGLKVKSPYKGKFEIWEYAEFADQIIGLYEYKILIYRESLIAENTKFEKMLGKIKNSLIPAESPHVSEELLAMTEEIDPENIAISILNYKSDLVRYRLIDLNVIEDQTHIYKMLEKYDTLNKVVEDAATHFQDIASMNNDLEKKKYVRFLQKALGRLSLLDQYIRDQEVWVKNRQHFIGTRTAEMKETVRWGLSPSDSIAVFTEPEGQLSGRLTNYIISDTTHFFVVAGFDIVDSPYKGFIGRVDPGMNLLWKNDITTSFTSPDSLQSEEYFKMVPGKPDLITIYFSEDSATYQFLAVDKSSGDVKWKAKVVTPQPVFDVRFSDLTDETVLYLDDPDKIADGVDVPRIVISKNGKVRKL